MANTQRLSPQGYNINNAPLNENPFWAEEETGGNVPSGGLTGQALVKRSNADYDTEWKTIQSGGGLPAGGAAGDLLTKTESGAVWETPDFASSDDLEATDAIAREARTAATTNAAAITAETNRATAAEQANAAAITSEASRAATAEASLSSDIAAVEQDVAGLDSALQDEIDRAEAAESDLSGLITAESDRAQAAESSLSDDIDGVAADLSTEETNRAAADTQIRSDLTADITAEATTRATNDAALQTQIDQITGSIPTPAQFQEVPDLYINSVKQSITLDDYNMSSASTSTLMVLRQLFDSATQTVSRFWQKISSGLLLNLTSVASRGCLFVLPGSYPASMIGTVDVDTTDTVAGGTTGQVLTKTSNTDYDWEWATPATGGGDTLPDQTYNNTVITNITDTATSTASGKFSYLQQYFNGTQLTRRWKMMQGLIADLIGFFSGGSVVSNAFLMTDNTQSSDYGGVPVKPVYGLFRTGTAASAGQLLVASGGLNSAAVLTDTVIGGTAGQVLTKSSSNNYDWEWITPALTNDFTVLEPTGDKVKGFKTIPGLLSACVNLAVAGGSASAVMNCKTRDASMYSILADSSYPYLKLYETRTTRRGNYSDANYQIANGEFLIGELDIQIYDNDSGTGTPIDLHMVSPKYVSSTSGGTGNPTSLDFDFNVGAATNNKVEEYDLSLVFGGSATSITSTSYTAAVSLAGHVEFKRFGGGTAAQNSGCIPFAVYDSGNNYYRIDNAGMVAYNFDGSTLHVKVLPNNAIASYSAAGASQWSSALCACQPKLIKTR